MRGAGKDRRFQNHQDSPEMQSQPLLSPLQIYVHCSEWGELLDWTVEPIIADADAGAACKAAWPGLGLP